MAALAQPEVTILSPQEIAARLSPREFIKLCDLIDGLYGKTERVASIGAGRHGNCAVEERHLPCKFDVLDIVRQGRELWVTVATNTSGGWTRLSLTLTPNPVNP